MSSDDITKCPDFFASVDGYKPKGLLGERFIFPPFSVLDTKRGEWQKRKKAWKNIGIQSELGRSAKAINMDLNYITKHNIQGCVNDGKSIFDPVLCELIYSWWSPMKGIVIDPFAGGSVRGIIASKLNREYWGCDLSSNQIKANYIQSNAICTESKPIWVIGDSLYELDKAPNADFILTCPPYGNLEKYSDHPNDLSNMTYNNFKLNYSAIIQKACDRLNDNSFACFVVGNYRDNKGNYIDIIGDTISSFSKSGLYLYNELILLNMIGTACLRVTKQFDNSRKSVKVHQNILIFLKGDAKIATDKIKESYR